MASRHVISDTWWYESFWMVHICVTFQHKLYQWLHTLAYVLPVSDSVYITLQRRRLCEPQAALPLTIYVIPKLFSLFKLSFPLSFPHFRHIHTQGSMFCVDISFINWKIFEIKSIKVDSNWLKWTKSIICWKLLWKYAFPSTSFFILTDRCL